MQHIFVYQFGFTVSNVKMKIGGTICAVINVGKVLEEVFWWLDPYAIKLGKLIWEMVELPCDWIM